MKLLTQHLHIGVKLIGGCKDNKCLNQYFGIYIRKLLPHGLACLDGKLLNKIMLLYEFY